MAKINSKPKVMLDSNVIISGITCPRQCFEILNHAFKQDFSLFLSEIILEEVKRNIQRKFPPYLLNLKYFLLHCPFDLILNPGKEKILDVNFISHANDIPVILAAIEANVDFFITGDKEIISDSIGLKEKILFFKPGDFLKEVMGWPEEELKKVSLRNWQDLKG